MKRYEAVVVGEPELVLDLLRSSFPDGGSDGFTLDAGAVPGTRFSTGRVEGRFVRVEGGVRVVAEAGAQKTHTASSVAAGVLVLVVVSRTGTTGGVQGVVAGLTTAAFGLGVIYVFHQWIEAKAADHALRRLEGRLAEVRELLQVHRPPP